MRTFAFTLWLADDPRAVEDWSNAMYESGATDSTCGMSNGQLFAAFDRRAASLEDAIRSALQQVHAAGLRAIRCEMEEQELATWASHG